MRIASRIDQRCQHYYLERDPREKTPAARRYRQGIGLRARWRRVDRTDARNGRWAPHGHAGGKPINAGPANRHRRERDTSRPSGLGHPASSHVLWIGSGTDGLDHCVTLDEVGASVDAGHGIYTSLCRARFVPLPMLAGPRPRCARCRRHREQPIATSTPTRLFRRLASKVRRTES